MRTSLLQVVELEDRLTPSLSYFVPPPGETANGPVNVQFEWGRSDTTRQNEVGFFVIDDQDGRVDGLLPSDPGYAGVALARAQTVFFRGSGNGTKADVQLRGGQGIALYLVSDDTLRAARTQGATVFFTFAAANSDKLDHARSRLRGDGGMDFLFEDQFGDSDFDDANISITRTRGFTAPGLAGQTVTATAAKLEGRNTGEFGLYRIDNVDGVVGAVAPTDPRYLATVLDPARRLTLFAAGESTPRTVTLQSEGVYAWYFVAGGSADDARAGNATAYFSFSTANPDRLDHFDWRTADTVGIEDQFGGGDQDFNDAVFQLRVGTPVGTPPAATPPVISPPSPPPPPPVPDTTPPVASFQLNNDTGASSTDLITSDPQGVLTVSDEASPIATLRARYDSTDTTTYVDILGNRAANGTVTVNTALATILNGGVALPDGVRTLFVLAADSAGNSQIYQFPITLDRVAPAAPTTFGLAATSDTGPTGDLRTDNPSVSLTGSAPAGSLVQLTVPPLPGTPGTGTVNATVTADTNGLYIFSNVPLAVGPNSFTVRTTDSAGNVSTSTLSQTFVRNAAPTLTTVIADQTSTSGGGPLTFSLPTNFADAERVARFVTSFPTGQTNNIDFQLFATQTPATVNNFLAYVNSGNAAQNYNGSIFHRLAPGFVLQGGGFKFNAAGTTTATKFPEITDLPAVVNEPVVSNTRGTLAMAKLGSDPNSATTEFFFNLADNSENLNNQNGGFTVFGQVMNGGQQALDTLVGAMTTFNGPGLPGAAPFPVRPGADTNSFPTNISAADLAIVTTASELTTAQKLSFTALSSDTLVATVSVAANGTLTVTPLAVGQATITVTATDLDGAQVTTSFQLTVQ